jgi:hypothetical protein
LIYNLAHNWATGLAVLALAWWLGSPAIGLAGAILVAHTGLDRAAGTASSTRRHLPTRTSGVSDG